LRMSPSMSSGFEEWLWDSPPLFFEQIFKTVCTVSKRLGWLD